MKKDIPEYADMLIAAARSATKMSYSPYSGFAVGAALLASDGRVFTGCNVENAAFSPTCCAERVAIFKAVSEGVRSFRAIAVACEKDGEPRESFYPCGVCRQVMREFCGEDFYIITDGADGKYEITDLSDMLPHSFSHDKMK